MSESLLRKDVAGEIINEGLATHQIGPIRRLRGDWPGANRLIETRAAAIRQLRDDWPAVNRRLSTIPAEPE